MLARCLCVLELLLRKERSMHVPLREKKKGGKGSLTYDVKYIDTDLTECTKPPQAAYITFQHESIKQKKMGGGRKISGYKLLNTTPHASNLEEREFEFREGKR